MRIDDWIFDQVWGITPNSLETIVKIVDDWRDRGDDEKAAVIDGRKNKNLDNARSVVVTEEGIAIIPIIGPIFPRANLLTEISGATSIEVLTNNFAEALENKAVNAIIFDIDSPGGQVTQVSELADFIYNSRGIKPIISFASGYMASAAYWIGSSADTVIASNTSKIGSIGVYAAVRDTTERDEKDGIKTYSFVSSVSPKKNLNPVSDDGKKSIQTIIDDVADVFISAVARNRSVPKDKVISDFGGGDVFVGQRAVQNNLIDRVDTFMNIVATYSNGNINKLSKGDGMAVKNETIETAETYSVEAIRESSPETFAEISDHGKKEGMSEGAKAERERLKAIDAVKAPGFEDFIAAHKYDEGMTAEKLSLMILNEQNKRNDLKAQSFQKDGQALGDQLSQVDQGGKSADELEKQEEAAVVDAIVEGAKTYKPGSINKPLSWS